MSKTWTIFHNQACSKSRKALDLLNEHKIKATVINYLEQTPTVAELSSIVTKLKLKPRDIVRTKEKSFAQLKLDLDNDQMVLEALAKNPKLIERPIVICDQEAIIARPPEALEQLL